MLLTTTGLLIFKVRTDLMLVNLTQKMFAFMVHIHCSGQLKFLYCFFNFSSLLPLSAISFTFSTGQFG